MKTDSPWPVLERLPSQAAVLALWHRLLGHCFGAFADALLQCTNQVAASYPCPRDCGCWHQVVHHTAESLARLNCGPRFSCINDEDKQRKESEARSASAITAVCRCSPARCAPLVLAPDDLLVWQLNWTRLGRALAQALNLELRQTALNIPHTRQIGSWSADTVPVVLSIQSATSQLCAVITELSNRLRRRFILLAPTSDLLDATAQELLANAGAGFFALDRHVQFTVHGALQPTQSPGELFAAFTPQPGSGPDENAARRAFALAEQLGAQALEVFRLYCVEGLNPSRIARKAGCARATVYRRLDLIRARTGMDPAQLRSLSPHLARIEDAASDSRAARIQRTRLIQDDEEETG